MQEGSSLRDLDTDKIIISSEAGHSNSTTPKCIACKSTENIAVRKVTGGGFACKNCYLVYKKLRDDKCFEPSSKCSAPEKCEELKKTRKMEEIIRGRHALCDFCKWQHFLLVGFNATYQRPIKKQKMEEKKLPPSKCLFFDEKTNKWKMEISEICSSLNDLVLTFDGKPVEIKFPGRVDPKASRELLLSHIGHLVDGFTEHKINMWIHIFSRTDQLSLSFFEQFEYVANCLCQCAETTIEHSLHDFFIRIGWVEVSWSEDEQIFLEMCPKRRTLNRQEFEQLVNFYKICPYPVRMDALHQIAHFFQLPNFVDPASNCEHCGDGYITAAPHIIANLLEQFGLVEGEVNREKMRKYCSHSCLGKDSGYPIRSRDLLDFFIFSSKFIAYGPNKNEAPLPPNLQCHSLTKEIRGMEYYFRPNAELDDSTLCFVFCRRHSSNDLLPTKGTAMYFGTKKRCFAGVATYSNALYFHWHFVPKAWPQTGQLVDAIVQHKKQQIRQ